MRRFYEDNPFDGSGGGGDPNDPEEREFKWPGDGGSAGSNNNSGSTDTTKKCVLNKRLCREEPNTTDCGCQCGTSGCVAL